MIRAMSTGSVPRGVRSSDTKPTRLSEPPSGGVPRWPLPRAAGSSEKSGFCVEVSRLRCVSARGGQQRWEPRAGGKRAATTAPLGPCRGGGGSATPFLGFVPPGLQFMACTAEGSDATGRSRRRRRRRTPAANLPARLARGSEAPARPTARRKWRGASCHPKYLSAALGCGARAPRAPRPLAAARSRPRGRRQARWWRVRVRVRAPARAGSPGSAYPSGRCGAPPASCSRPASRPGTEAREERVRGGGGGRRRRREPEPRVSHLGARGGSTAPKGLGADATAAGRAAHQLLRLLRRYPLPRRRGVGDPAECPVTAGALAFLAPVLPAPEWAPEVVPEPRARIWSRRRGMPRAGTGLRQPEKQRWGGRRAGAGPGPAREVQVILRQVGPTCLLKGSVLGFLQLPETNAESAQNLF